MAEKSQREETLRNTTRWVDINRFEKVAESIRELELKALVFGPWVSVKKLISPKTLNMRILDLKVLSQNNYRCIVYTKDRMWE